jgi:hypothetical protein
MFGAEIRTKPLVRISAPNNSRFILICTIVENNEVKTVRKKTCLNLQVFSSMLFRFICATMRQNKTGKRSGFPVHYTCCTGQQACGKFASEGEVCDSSRIILTSTRSACRPR